MAAVVVIAVEVASGTEEVDVVGGAMGGAADIVGGATVGAIDVVGGAVAVAVVVVGGAEDAGGAEDVGGVDVELVIGREVGVTAIAEGVSLVLFLAVDACSLDRFCFVDSSEVPFEDLAEHLPSAPVDCETSDVATEEVILEDVDTSEVVEMGTEFGACCDAMIVAGTSAVTVVELTTDWD